MLYIIVIVVIGFILSMFTMPKSNKKQIQNEIDIHTKVKQMINNKVENVSKEYINKEFSRGIVIDEVNKKVHVFNFSSNFHKSYPFNKVIQSDVIIDHSTITTTNRGKQVVGMAVGSMVAGVGGMIVGGLSSEQISNEQINKMELKLTFKDMDNPTFTINFLNHPKGYDKKGYKKDSPQVRTALSYMDKWYGYFNIILKQQNQAI